MGYFSSGGTYATSGGYPSGNDSSGTYTSGYPSSTGSYPSGSSGGTYYVIGWSNYFIEGGSLIGPTTISIYGSHPTRGQIGGGSYAGSGYGYYS